MSETPTLKALLSRHEGMSPADWERKYSDLERDLGAAEAKRREAVRECAAIAEDCYQQDCSPEDVIRAAFPECFK